MHSGPCWSIVSLSGPGRLSCSDTGVSNLALKEEQKIFITTRLAAFNRPSKVVKEFSEVFGERIDRRRVHYYDASCPGNTRLGQKWRKLFWSLRDEFLKRVEDIPMSYKAYRLRQLQALYEQAIDAANIPLAKELLEQAAKEMGEAYSNRRLISGPGGGPIHHSVTGKIDLRSLTNEQLQRIADGEDPADVIRSEG